MEVKYWLVPAAWVLVGSVIVAAAEAPTSAMSVSVAVMGSAWFFGLRGAIVGALAGVPVHLVCAAVGGIPIADSMSAPMLLGHFFTALFALTLGWSRTLRDRLESETQRRLESERARVQAQMEARMLRADRLATVGTMAAGVAHEVNNPLTYILGNLELLADEIAERKAAHARGESPPEPDWGALETDIHDTQDGAARILSIMSELKLFVREDESELSPVNLHAVAETSAKLTRHELGPGTVLVRELDEVPAIRGDAGKLAQVFVNLIVNAAQAIPDNHDGGQIVLGLRVERDEVVAQVSDNGSGMSDEIKARIFDPFFTTKPVGVGTGLGLPVCASIVRQHGGELELDSEVGRGTTFRLRFPTLVQDAAVPG